MSDHAPQKHLNDPLVDRVRQICLTLPDAKERISHGSPNWYTTKTFCWWGAHVGKHDRSRLADDALGKAISILAAADEYDALLESGRFYVPAYIGHRGWLAIDLSGEHSGDVDWDEIAELIDMSFRETASKRLVAVLDAREA